MASPWGRTTFYNGIRMRSRLEASFAAWMDQRGWTWRYEPHAFATADGQYLPDFLVETRGQRFYIEIKPTRYHVTLAVLANVDIIHASEPHAHFGVVIPEWQLVADDGDLIFWIEGQREEPVAQPAFVRAQTRAGVVWLPTGPEVNALLALFHQPGAFDLFTTDTTLIRSLFEDPINVAVYDALLLRSASSLAHVLEAVPAEVSELLLELSTASLEGGTQDALARLVREAARRAVVASHDPIPIETHQALNAINEPDTQHQGVLDLLAWIKTQRTTT